MLISSLFPISSRPQRNFLIEFNEVNSDHFKVERSADLIEWETIGTLQAQGFSVKIMNYGLYDYSPLQGRSYYRLKSIDRDGSFEHSHNEVVNYSSVMGGFAQVFPNPNDGSFTIQFEDYGRILSIEIHDALGQIVRIIENPAQGNISISALTNGLYSMSIRTQNERFTIPVIVSQ